LVLFHCLLQFSSPTFSVDEGGGSALITVNRTRFNHPDISVQVNVTGGTATAGADFGTFSQTLSWADGEMGPRTLRIPIANDRLAEGPETIKLSLSNPTNGSSIGSIGTATLTIRDDDTAAPRPAIRIQDVTVREGDRGTRDAAFQVKLSSPSTLPVQVSFSTSNGTARAPGDYVARPSSRADVLTFRPGQTTKSIVVKVKGDALSEGRETFLVNLSHPVNATIADRQGKATILDNDPSRGRVRAQATPILVVLPEAESAEIGHHARGRRGS